MAVSEQVWVDFKPSSGRREMKKRAAG